MSISEENNKSKNEISRKVFLALSSNVMVTLFGLISLFFIKRYMGYEALGIFAFAMAYVSLFKIANARMCACAHTRMRVGAHEKRLRRCAHARMRAYAHVRICAIAADAR